MVLLELVVNSCLHNLTDDAEQRVGTTHRWIRLRGSLVDGDDACCLPLTWEEFKIRELILIL